MYFILFPAGRTRSVQGEQTGKGRYPGDDSQVLEAKNDRCAAAPVNAAAVQTGRLHGRIQAVRGTGPRAAGGTVDGRTAASVGSAHGPAPRGVCTEVGLVVPATTALQEPFIVHVVLRRIIDNPQSSIGAHKLHHYVLLLVRGRRHRGGRAAATGRHHRGSDGSAGARQPPQSPHYHPVPGHSSEVNVEALVKRRTVCLPARPFPSDSAFFLLLIRHYFCYCTVFIIGVRRSFDVAPAIPFETII